MEEIEFVLTKTKDCKHTVVFGTDHPDAPVNSVYVNRNVPGIEKARQITLKLIVHPT